MIIRRIKKEDRDEWLRMRRKLWPKCSLEKHVSEMKKYSSDPKFAIFVAVLEKGKLVGFVEACLRDSAEGCDTSPVGYIEGWYVEPHLREKGIGKKLARAAESWAISKGCKEMASDCFSNNKLSLKAHLAIGYKKTRGIIHFKKSLK